MAGETRSLLLKGVRFPAGQPDPTASPRANGVLFCRRRREEPRCYSAREEGSGGRRSRACGAPPCASADLSGGHCHLATFRVETDQVDWPGRPSERLLEGRQGCGSSSHQHFNGFLSARHPVWLLVPDCSCCQGSHQRWTINSPPRKSN